LFQNLWFQFLIIMVWWLGGRHNSIQLCISFFEAIKLFHLFQIVLVLYIYFRGLISHLLVLMQSWQISVLESLLALQFSFKLWCRAYVLQLEFTCMLQGAWTWLGSCNSRCCGLLELDLDLAIQDVAGCLNLTWILQFKMLRVAWTWLGSCNSRCCGLLEPYLDAAI
jgi:hypothetical protein